MHLTIETGHSLARSLLKPEKTIARLAEDGLTHFATADRGAGGALHKWSVTAQKKGLSLVPGATIQVGKDGLNTIRAYAMSDAALPSFYRAISADPKDVAGHLLHDDILVLTGGLEDGVLPKAKTSAAIAEVLGKLTKFGLRVAVEVERINGPAHWESMLYPAFDILGDDLPIVATSPARHLGKEDKAGLDLLTFMKFRKDTSPEHARLLKPVAPQGLFLKSSAQMAALFADMPGALDNARAILSRSTTLIKDAKPMLPRFDGMTDEAQDHMVIDLARKGLDHRLQRAELADSLEVYNARLDYELGLITKMRFSGYFLIVADYIRYSREIGVPVGPGRGSGAGSIVAWALGITDLDPIRFGLLFERFINPDRVSLPDFDVDFCTNGRDRIITYLLQRYGAEYAAKISAYGTLQARGAYQLAAASLDIPPGAALRTSKLIPKQVESLAAEAAADTPYGKAVAKDAEIAAAHELAILVEATPSSASEHAAGVVISEHPLKDFAPVRISAKTSSPVLMTEMKSTEAIGLVKFDLLGLSTLTIIQRTCDIQAARGIEIDWRNLPLKDQSVFDMLNAGWTHKVFQLEGDGITRSLRQVKPSTFEDLIALVALYRPGPMEYIPLYALRKAGAAPVEYPHPSLEKTLAETYGIIVYQEQIMEMARLVAGYTLGESDLLRRAIGKKIPAEVAAQGKLFVEKCLARGMSEAEAKRIFDYVLPFAAYGFNKSHAAAYALIAWITAYLKRHHTYAFLAANLDDDSKPEELERTVREAERLKIPVVGCDINLSDWRFTVEDQPVPQIRYSLAALKGFGINVAKAIVQERERGGSFTSVADFLERCFEFVDRAGCELLAAAGAFDSLDDDRSSLLANIAGMRTAARGAGEGQADLFASSEVASNREKAIDAAELINRATEAYGYRFANHPTEIYKSELDRGRAMTLSAALAAVRPKADAEARVIVEIDAIGDDERAGRVMMRISDWTQGARVGVADGVTPPIIDKRPLVLTVDLKNVQGRVVATSFTAPAAQSKAASEILIQIDATKVGEVLDAVRRLAKEHPGSALVSAQITGRSPRKTSITLDSSKELLAKLRAVTGLEHVSVH